jgi:hypothetical protein
MIPKFPIFLAITLSSKEFNPNKLAYLTSFKHFPHLWTACFVSPTKNGIMSMLINPNISIANTAIKYPSMFVSYATIEKVTASQ